MIIKYSQATPGGIQSHQNSRHGIGFLVRGRKYIYYGDARCEINRGDIFYLGVGNYYFENIPEADRNFEQIIFYYTQEQLARILNQLSVGYQMNITNNHTCPNCHNRNHVVYPAWS